MIVLLLLIPFTGCGQKKKQSAATNDQQYTADKDVFFAGPQPMGELNTGLITEASGMVVSSKNDNAIWVHNDSGNAPVLFLIDQKANVLKSFVLEGIENRDWEDIALGPGPEAGKSYLYLGDIGDNLGIRDQKIIYRFPEPEYAAGTAITSDTVKIISSIHFIYPDGKHDAEVLMIDPLTQDLFIISKNLERPAIYKLAADSIASANKQNPAVLEHCGDVEFTEDNMFGLITGGDIGSDGTEVLIKTYSKVYYWKKEDPESSICELLRSTPDSLTYEPEPQGEAIAFGQSKDGYYTLSEKRFGSIPILYFYPRK